MVDIIDRSFVLNPMIRKLRIIQKSKWNLDIIKKELIGTSMCPVRVLDQHNVIWKPLRKYLIGSSDFHRFCNIHKSDRPIEVIAKHINKDISTAEGVKEGRLQEPEVRLELEKEYLIDYAALWIHPDAFVVCATPDGVILNKTTRRPESTLEIKYVNKKYDEEKLPSFLFKDKDGSLGLKDNSEYMKQVQG